MNKWILITGSSRGIGRETALYLAENGYNIVLHCSKNTSRLDSLKEQIIQKGVEARTVAFDIKNLGGFYNVLKPIIMPLIQQKRGRIIVMSSISGQCGNRGQVNYSASKAGLIGAAKALSQEVAKRKITVNCIAPGIIETDMTEELPEEAVKQIPMRRMGSGKEVASLVNYLLSEDAGYITGQVIAVNGGLYL